MSKGRVWHFIGPCVAIVFFVLALWALHGAFDDYRYADVLSAFRALSATSIVLAVILTLTANLALVGYDVLAMRYVGRALPLRQVALASFVSYAFSNSVGNTLLTGGALRYWLYGSIGLSAGEIARIVVFCSLGFWLGYLLVGGVLFTLEAVAIPHALHLPFQTTQIAGALMLLVLGAYLAMVATRRAPLKLGEWMWPLPSVPLTIGQIGVAVSDVVSMAAVLYVLLPHAEGLSFPVFLVISMLALAAGATSQVPGGLGVFETIVVLLVAPYVDAPQTTAALLAFRGIYFVLPLVVATVVLGVREGRQRLPGLRTAMKRAGPWMTVGVPHVFAAAIFVSGAMLLFSGALPAVADRLTWLHRFVPLALIEMSHFLASLAGVGLLLLARGLQRRLDGAFALTLMVLAAAIVFSVAKGFDYEEATVLAAILIALAPCRKYFYRRSSLFAEPLKPAWIASTAIVLAGTAWLALFAFKRVEYSSDLWWQFTLKADAPRTNARCRRAGL